jgi:hypothetical protein
MIKARNVVLRSAAKRFAFCKSGSGRSMVVRMHECASSTAFESSKSHLHARPPAELPRLVLQEGGHSCPPPVVRGLSSPRPAAKIRFFPRLLAGGYPALN